MKTETEIVTIGGREFDVTFICHEGDQEIPHFGDGTGQQGTADEVEILGIKYYGEDFYEFFDCNNLIEEVEDEIWKTFDN